MYEAGCQTDSMKPSGKISANGTSAAESFNQICTVKIELLDTDPLIWREAEVPTSITLKVLHDIFQITMGWLDYHLWTSAIGGRGCELPMNEDWGTTPRTEATKVRLRDVLKPGVFYPHSAANGTARPRPAAAYRASTTGSMRSPTQSIRTMQRSPIIWTVGTPRRSMNFFSESPSVKSPTAAMP